MERAQLTDSELTKYRLDCVKTSGQTSAKAGDDTAGRQRLQAMIRRMRAPTVQTWMQRQRSAISKRRPIRDHGAACADVSLTLEQMVMQGVVPGELATAAARTFNWDGEHIITEDAFVELFVPVPPEDYHSLDFMRAFRRAWLAVNEARDNSAVLDAPNPAGSWFFEEGGGIMGGPPFQLQRVPSRPSSAPAAPGRGMRMRGGPLAAAGAALLQCGGCGGCGGGAVPSRPAAPAQLRPPDAPDLGARPSTPTGRSRPNDSPLRRVSKRSQSVQAMSGSIRASHPALPPLGARPAESAETGGSRPPTPTKRMATPIQREQMGSGVVAPPHSATAGSPRRKTPPLIPHQSSPNGRPLSRSPSPESYEDEVFEELSDNSAPGSPKHALSYKQLARGDGVYYSGDGVNSHAMQNVGYKELVRKSTTTMDSTSRMSGLISPSGH